MGKNSLRRKIRQLSKGEQGQTLVLTCIGLLCILTMAGLGIDVGYLHFQKHQMQKAADAAALAGASVLAYSTDNSRIMAAARYDSKANGFENGVNDIAVMVNHPPASGPFLNNPGYVEVYVSQPRPTFFMRVAGFTSANVRSRAVATSLADASGCIYALDPHSPQSLLIDGNVTVASTCGIYVDSDSTDALHKNGNSGGVTVTGGDGIGVVGDYMGRGFSPTPVQIPVQQDPLSEMPAPAYTKTPCASPVGKVYSPGTYCGGIHITGNGDYTFKPGTYVILGGGFTVTGGPTLTGTDVMFYLTQDLPSRPYGGVDFGGNVTLNFTCPMTGTYAGILFFQDRAIPVGSDTSKFLGTNSSSFTGAIYFPTTDVQFKGTPGLATHTVLVAWQLDFRGDASIDNNILPGGGSPLKSAALAE